jgi:hypothetical protein
MLGIEAFESNKSGLRRVAFPATTSLRNLAMQTFVEDFLQCRGHEHGCCLSGPLDNRLHHEEKASH